MAVTDPTSLAGAGAPGRPHGAGTLAERVSLPLLAKIYIIAVMIPVAFPMGPLYMTGLRLVLSLAILPLFFMLLSGRYGKLILPDILFLLHVVWMAVAFSVTVPLMMVQNIGAAGIEFYGGYLLGRATIRSQAQFIALCRFLMIAVLVTLPLAVIEGQTGRPPVIDFIRSLGVASVQVVNIDIRMGFERAQVVFAHPIHYGLFASTAFSLTYIGLKDLIPTGLRLLAALGIGICVFFSLSSGPLLAMIMQLGLIAWAMMFRKTDKRWHYLVAFAAFCYVVVDLLSNRTPIEVFFSYATFSSHNAYWRGIIFEWGLKNVFGDAEQKIPPAPLFGIGLRDWVRPSFMHSGSMDNFWLVTIVRYGVPGFLTLAVPYAWALWKIGRKDFGSEGVLWNLRRGWMICFVGLTFALCTVHVWTSVYSYVFFLFGAGMWFLTATREEADAGPAQAAPGPVSRYTRFPAAPSRAAPVSGPASARVASPAAARAESGSGGGLSRGAPGPAPSRGRPGRAP